MQKNAQTIHISLTTIPWRACCYCVTMERPSLIRERVLCNASSSPGSAQGTKLLSVCKTKSRGGLGHGSAEPRRCRIQGLSAMPVTTFSPLSVRRRPPERLQFEENHCATSLKLTRARSAIPTQRWDQATRLHPTRLPFSFSWTILLTRGLFLESCLFIMLFFLVPSFLG